MPNEQHNVLKLILVGPSSVGKTSLITSYFNQQFHDQTASTVAPAFCSAIVKTKAGKEIQMQIWDTAGQEQYQSISQMFYRDSQVCFACFDKDNTETIQGWIDTVRSQVPSCLFVLVITKSDLYSEDELNQMREIGKALKQKNDAKGLFITSSKTRQGINDLFQSAAFCYELFNTASMPNIQVINQQSENEQKKCFC